MPEEFKSTLPLDETEVLATTCLLFSLRHNEAQLLLSLITHSFRTHDQLRAIFAHPAVSTSTWNVTLHSLRKKLKPHGIKIINISKVGYMIDTKGREKIHKLLAEHDAAIIPLRPKSKDETDFQPDASA